MSDQGGSDGTATPPSGDEPQPGGGPPADNRLPWILAAVLAVIALILLGLLLWGGDDGDDDDSASSTTSSSTTSTTEQETTTSTSEQETTTSSSTPPDSTTSTSSTTPVTADPAQCVEAGSDPVNPDPAAVAVFIAWTRGDVDCADPLMTDDALDELFARDGAGATDIFQGCVEVDEPDPHFDCGFTYPGGSTHYLMNFSPTDGWQVYDIEQIAD